jgi:hypothetical protein
LRAIATDDSGLQRIGTITIELIDVNEAPVMVSEVLVTTLTENPENGTTVISAPAIDADAGETLTCAIISGNDDGAFAISGTSCLVTVADGGLIDHETNAERTLVVRVTDHAGLYDEATVTVAIEDITQVQRLATYTFSSTGLGVIEGQPAAAWTLSAPYQASASNNSYPLVTSVPSNYLSGTMSVSTQGNFDWDLDMTYRSGSMNAALPIAMNVSFPDSVLVGVPFEITAGWEMLAGATMAGTTTGLSFDATLELQQWRMNVSASMSSEILHTSANVTSSFPAIITGRRSTDAEFEQSPIRGALSFGGDAWIARRFADDYPAGVNVEQDQDTSWMGAALGENGHLNRPNLLYTQQIATPMYQSSLDLADWLASEMPYWANATSGSILQPLGNDTFVDIDYSLTTGGAAQYLWAGLTQGYYLEVTGVLVLLTFENGQTVSFDAGSPATVQLSSGADANGDGRVSVSASFRPRATFTNHLQPYFRYDLYWMAGELRERVYRQDINQFSGQLYTRVIDQHQYGPMISLGVSASMNMDQRIVEDAPAAQVSSWLNVDADNVEVFEIQTFEVNNWNSAVMRGSIQLAQ